jgi:hypothetical protein
MHTTVRYRDLELSINREKGHVAFLHVPELPEPIFCRMYRELVRKVLQSYGPKSFDPYNRVLPLSTMPDTLEDSIRAAHDRITQEKIPLSDNI